jgi:hypothetical protein
MEGACMVHGIVSLKKEEKLPWNYSSSFKGMEK